MPSRPAVAAPGAVRFVAACLCCVPLLLPFRSARAAPAEYLPVRHAAYEELDALAAMGVLDSIALHTRPIIRVDVARALDRARRIHPGIERDIHWRRLEREFARELRDLGIGTETRESGPALDRGAPGSRFRAAASVHLRGDFDEKREAAHFRLRDETAGTARLSLALGDGFGAYEEIGLTRIRGQRDFIDAIALHSDVEVAVLRGEVTARSGALTAAAGYESFRWGPGRRGTLLLGDAAGPMTFLALQGSAGGRVHATALSAVVSAADRRYLAAHRLEFLVTPRVRLGVAEAVRYAADGIDLLYAGGLLPYAIVERIRIRDASNDSVRAGERANIMAAADVAVRLAASLSVYGELLVDDFATESNDMPSRIAYQIGLRSERPYGSRHVHMLGEYTRVRNFTYAVYYGQDFVHRSRPLGFALGPDLENVTVETRLDVSRDWQLRWTADFTNRGEGRLGVAWDPGQRGVSNVGLLGVVEERREIWGDLRWIPRDNVDLSAGAGFRRIRSENNVAGRDRESWLGRLALDLRY